MLTPGRPAALRLHERLEAGDGVALELTDSVQLREHPRVARFRVHRGNRWVEVEALPGDLLAAGPFVLRLDEIVSREKPATLSVFDGPEASIVGSIGRPFPLAVGQRDYDIDE